jgi:alcohol dehydrogenase class IV
LALANAGLGAVHGIAGPLGGMVEAPHGALCAALLPHVMAVNVRALRARTPGSPALARYVRVAQLLTGDPAAAAEDAAGWVLQLVADLGIPGLSIWGVGTGLIGELVTNAARASSMKANPVELTRDELAAIVQAAL